MRTISVNSERYVVVYIPVHCYDCSVGVNFLCNNFEPKETGATVKFVQDNKTFYGLYEGLPNTGQDERELLRNLRYPFVSGKCLSGQAKNLHYCSFISPSRGYFRVEGSFVSEELVRQLEQGDFSFMMCYITENIFRALFPNEKPLYGTPQSSLLNTMEIIGNNYSEDAIMAYSTQKYSVNNDTEKEEKKEKKMSNLFGNIKVGKAGKEYALTYWGTIAYCNKSYINGQIYEVEGMTIPFDMLYFVPANQVAVGDMIEKEGIAYVVTSVVNGTVQAVNLREGKAENLVNGGPFGMTMYSKLFNPMAGMSDGNNPMANIFMMKALMGEDGGSDNGMLMAMMMMQGGFQFPNFGMTQMQPKVAAPAIPMAPMPAMKPAVPLSSTSTQ